MNPYSCLKSLALCAAGAAMSSLSAARLWARITYAYPAISFICLDTQTELGYRFLLKNTFLSTPSLPWQSPASLSGSPAGRISQGERLNAGRILSDLKIRSERIP